MNKYFNPNTRKTEELFTTLNPVYQVWYKGDKGDHVYIILEAKNEDDAKIKAMNNQEFTSHILGKYFDRKYLTAHKPNELYVIGEIKYYNK